MIWKEIEAEKMMGNVFNMIGKEWMLITAGVAGQLNTMTASWGGMGVLWHKSVAFIFVRPTRYTDEFIRKHDVFSLSFFEEKHRKALEVCGTMSGRDTDKIRIAGLSPEVLPDGSMGFQEARLTLSCRKIYQDVLRPEEFLSPEIEKNYPKKDYHNIYIGEINRVFERA